MILRLLKFLAKLAGITDKDLETALIMAKKGKSVNEIVNFLNSK